MKTTKTWFITAIITLTIVAFAGCGSDDADTKTAGDTESATIEFETVDLDGNKVSSREIFAENQVTMINFWGTFCGPCIKEMPEIQAISNEYSPRGAQVIGVLVDVTADDTGDAKAILSDAGATYRNLIGWKGFEGLLPEGAIPTTWFVDSEGKVIGKHVVGADPKKYREALDEYLPDEK